MENIEKTTNSEQTPEAQNASDILSEMPSFDDWRSQQTEDSPNESSEASLEEDRSRSEAFRHFTQFLDKDLAIKNTLADLAPTQQDLYQDGTIDYSDKLYEGLKDIKDDFDVLGQLYHSDAFEARLKQIEQDVVRAGTDPQKLEQCYRTDFSDISEEFGSQVHKNVKGYYTPSEDAPALDTQAKSINEMLHLAHASVMNNDSILRSLPILESNENEIVTLYGTEASRNDTAQGIFDKMKDEKKFETTIISLQNRTIIMVRELGHALSIDVSRDPDGKQWVDYFIPKICNVDKVNQLPGVRKITKQPGMNQAGEFTTGSFPIENDVDAPTAIIDFIKKVPDDFDMERTPLPEDEEPTTKQRRSIRDRLRALRRPRQ